MLLLVRSAGGQGFRIALLPLSVLKREGRPCVWAGPAGPAGARSPVSPAVLDSAEDLDRKRICRIVTRDFPQYFAVVSRVKQDSHLIGPEGGVLSSTVVPQVQAVFPEGALTKRIRVGLQVRRRRAGREGPAVRWGSG